MNDMSIGKKYAIRVVAEHATKLAAERDRQIEELQRHNESWKTVEPLLGLLQIEKPSFNEAVGDSDSLVIEFDKDNSSVLVRRRAGGSVSIIGAPSELIIRPSDETRPFSFSVSSQLPQVFTLNGENPRQPGQQYSEPQIVSMIFRILFPEPSTGD